MREGWGEKGPRSFVTPGQAERGMVRPYKGFAERHSSLVKIPARVCEWGGDGFR